MWQYDRIDIMIDAESLALKSNSPALPAISAATFNIKTGDIYGEIFKPISLNSLNKFDFDGEGLGFWFSQTSDLQDAIVINHNAVSIEQALEELHTFVSEARSISNSITIWACGPAEDAVWLKSAFNIALEKPAPWNYNEMRDVRTIRDMGRVILGIDPQKEIQFAGIEHHPQDDVRHQIKYVSKLWRSFAKSRRS